MSSVNVSFNEKKKELLSYFKDIEKFLKKEDYLKFDDLVTLILKSIRIIYSNPEKLLYHISLEKKNMESIIDDMLNLSEISEIPKITKDFSKKTQNNLLRSSIKIIYHLLKFPKNPKFSSLSHNQKYIYMHLMRHLLKECLYEMPLIFKNMFSRIFHIDLKFYSSQENFSILRSFFLEIGDYEIIKFELESENYNNIAKGFIYYIKALKKNEIVFPKEFAQIFEVFIFNIF